MSGLSPLRQPKTYGFAGDPATVPSGGLPPLKLGPPVMPALRQPGTPTMPVLRQPGSAVTGATGIMPSADDFTDSIGEKKESIFNDFAALLEQKKTQVRRPSSAIRDDGGRPSIGGAKDLSSPALQKPSAKSLDEEKLSSFDEGSGGATVFSPMGVKVDPSLGRTFKPGEIESVSHLGEPISGTASALHVSGGMGGSCGGAYAAMPVLGTPECLAPPEPFMAHVEEISEKSPLNDDPIGRPLAEIGPVDSTERTATSSEGHGVESDIESLEFADALQIRTFAQLEKFGWFHGNLGSSEATQALQGCDPGTFLVRYSPSSGTFCSSYVTLDGRIQHTRFEITPQSTFIEGGTGREWSSLQEMVQVFDSPGLSRTDPTVAGSDEAPRSVVNAVAFPPRGPATDEYAPISMELLQDGVVGERGAAGSALGASGPPNTRAVETEACSPPISPAFGNGGVGAVVAAAAEPGPGREGAAAVPRWILEGRLPKTPSEEMEFKSYQLRKYEQQQEENARQLKVMQRAQSLRALGARQPGYKFSIATMRSDILSTSGGAAEAPGWATPGPHSPVPSAPQTMSWSGVRPSGVTDAVLDGALSVAGIDRGSRKGFDAAIAELVASLPEAPSHPILTLEGGVGGAAGAVLTGNGPEIGGAGGAVAGGAGLGAGGPSLGELPTSSPTLGVVGTVAGNGSTGPTSPASGRPVARLTIEAAQVALREKNDKRLRTSGFFASLLAATPTNSANILNKVYTERNDPPVDKKGKRKKKKKGLTLTTSKHHLTFNLDPGAKFPLHQPLADSVILSNSSSKAAKFNFSVPVPARTHEWIITPDKGEVKKNSSLKITISLTIRTTITLQEVLVLRVKNFGPFFLPVNLASESSVFGTIPDITELVIDLGHEVPAVLCSLREYLDDHNGLKEPGIFRTKPLDETEVNQLKEKLNKDQFNTDTPCRDIHSISTLIKLWYRELPSPVLSGLPEDKLLSTSDLAEAAALVEGLGEPHRSIILWLLDLLAEVASYGELNEMSVRSLSAVVGPNLFNFADIPDPMRAMQLSQKAVSFVQLLLTWRVNARTASAGTE